MSGHDHDCHGGTEHDHTHEDDCDGECEDCDSGPDPVQPSIYADTVAEMRRRDYAKALATVGGLTAVASVAAPLASLQKVFEREYTGPIYGDGVPLVDAEGERISESRLGEGEQLTVFPEPRPGLEDAPTILVRFAQGEYGSGVAEEFTVSGYAAYSKVCTHAGCMVSDREGSTLVCPCHFGKFDPTGGGEVSGGPPPRGLPQLPITVSSDGYLVATADFDGSIGPGGE